MARFHVNPTTLESGLCRAATPQGCPFKSSEGVPVPHYSTLQEARTAADEQATVAGNATLSRGLSKGASRPRTAFGGGGRTTTPPATSPTGDSPSYAQQIDKATKREIVAMVDRRGEMGEYYAATDAKHFQDKTGPGSKFSDPRLKRVEDVLALAALQRGSLEGDDRDFFLAQGSSPEAFREGNRYLKIETPGTLGIKNTRDMKDDDLLQVVRTKPGTPCNLVAPVKEKPTTTYAVAVLTTNRDTGKPMVITTFPGLVTKNPRSEELDTREGETITVGEARRIMGGDVFANTSLVTQ